MRSKLIKHILTSLITLGILLSTPGFVNATEIVMSDNGSESENQIVVTQSTQTNIDQSNTANINNNIDVTANTGNNQSVMNEGDSTIKTGNVNVDTTVVNAVNSSSTDVGCCQQGGTNITVQNNGSGSTNTVVSSSNNSTNVTINQNANINNNINGKANTGKNETSFNNGDSTIKTGDINANTKVVNGPINFENVIVKSAKNSSNAKISGNGAESYNLISAYLNNYINIAVNNNIALNNDIDFKLNTGKNKANLNNGDVAIVTGDILHNLFIKNGPINFGKIKVDCCKVVNEKPDEDKNGEEKPKEEDEVVREKEEKGELLAEAAATEDHGNGKEILGLSVTSSGEGSVNVLFWIGLFMTAAGLKLLGEAISPDFEYNKA